MDQINFNNVIESPREKPFYQKVLKIILSFLDDNQRATLMDIIQLTEGGDRRTIRLLDEMVKYQLIRFKNGYFYPTKKESVPLTRAAAVCPGCKGKIVNQGHKQYQSIKNKMRVIYATKPKPTFVFDQRPVTIETSLRRAFYLAWRGDIHRKKIALIGDDDLTSLALGFLNLAQEIVVFEIDKRLVKFLRQQVKKYHLKVRVFERDVISGISPRYRHRFDVFLADPTPTSAPFTVFVNAGLQLLKKSEGVVGYLSFYPSCMDKSISLQTILTKMNLMITDSIPFFTEYEVIDKTYSEKDIKLMRQYSRSVLKMAFYEYLVRIQTTQNTKIMPLKIKLQDIIGRATQRVLKNFDKDPAINEGKNVKRYLLKSAHSLIKNKNRKIVFK